MRTVLIAAAAVRAGHTVSAQTVDPAFQTARAARNAAIMTGDEEGFRRYTTDDFIYVSLEGQAMTRVERAAANQGNNELPARQPLTDAKVRVYGDTIITSGRGELNVRGVMKPVRVMQVWVKRDGEWKIAHAQNTLIVVDKK
jgi:ketosteroid isomerase-like protein